MNIYKNILFLPLALPPIADKKKILNQFIGNDKYVWWKQETLLGSDHNDEPLGATIESWRPSARLNYPELIYYIEKNLPFKQLVHVRLARALGDIPPHVDENYVQAPFPHHRTATQKLIDHQQSLEPIGYRFIIQGSRNSLYLCDNYDPLYKKRLEKFKHYCVVPNDTDFFLIHNSKQPHGVTTNEKDEYRLVGSVVGFLDPDAHTQLIKKSLLKFPNNCVKKEGLFIATINN